MDCTISQKGYLLLAMHVDDGHPEYTAIFYFVTECFEPGIVITLFPLNWSYFRIDFHYDRLILFKHISLDYFPFLSIVKFAIVRKIYDTVQIGFSEHEIFIMFFH